jgi:hypothetical protein
MLPEFFHPLGNNKHYVKFDTRFQLIEGDRKVIAIQFEIKPGDS